LDEYFPVLSDDVAHPSQRAIDRVIRLDYRLMPVPPI